jgi:aminodeoxyfutalosine deaminase
MITLRARWVLPIAAPPVDEGWVAVDDGRIAAVGRERRHSVRSGADADVDLGRVALMPGLVNAHTHLELCWLAGRVGSAPRLTDWIRTVMAMRREQADPLAPAIVEPLRRGIAAMRAAGVAVVGDVSNTLASVGPLDEASQPARVFFELVRFRATDADDAMADALRRCAATSSSGDVRVAFAAHAPYSVSPRLFQLIRRENEHRGANRTSVHLGESVEEIEFLKKGTGPWRQLLQEVAAWDDSWNAPGCGPVDYLDRMGALDANTLVVHGTRLTRAELETVAARGATLVTCPRSNRHVGVGDPPVQSFFETGVRLAIGTDSLASAPDLGIFPELAALRHLAPTVPASRLLESATRIGAEALGFATEYGTIEPGRRADLLAIHVPAGVSDVEEYLVGGIDPGAIQWVG